ncbi:hypothetical protein NM208_g4826 [Fusarium decemcellulare]|uniref:Uncharacterized protein n=1 Tax=Fusarium decemcellulare TaxID=57161 RepID=A0ACC1SJH3_9HYPO|nr:hypothetical protein NM208_g4826 [Fusarium decemcellulare]
MFSKKVVLITGATAGIGLDAAEYLARQDWAVILSGRRDSIGQEAVMRLKEAGHDAAFVHCDVRSEQSVAELHNKAIAIWGRLDAAVNNAGISTDTGRFADLDTSKFRDMIDVNILGVFWSMQHQVKHMEAKNTGRIVNISSMAGRRGLPFHGTYAATKHAVIGMTKTAALEYASKGVTVNAIAPGAIRTQIMDNAIKSGKYTEESAADVFPVKKLGVAEDISRVILLILESPYMTGTVVDVDGGFSA